MKTPRRHPIAALLLAALSGVASGTAASADGPSPGEWGSPTISADTTWSGAIVLRRNVVVSQGATLRVAPGTVVRVEPGKGIGITVLGRLRVEGTSASSVRFEPATPAEDRGSWQGIALGGGAPVEHLLAGFRIAGASAGVAVTNALVRVREGVFAGCAAGVQVNQNALAFIDNCAFEGNDAGVGVSLGGRARLAGCRLENILKGGVVAEKGAAIRVSGCVFSRGKTGIFALTDAPCLIKDSQFLSLETGIVARQTGKESAVSRCLFENDQTALAAVQFSALAVSDSVFRGNKTGIDAREFSTPAVLHNLFERNGDAVNLFRKSHARVEKNAFSHNRNAMVLNYSSYPLIAGNNFERNDMNVRLEKFQSGDWEERAGSVGMTAAEAARRGSPAMPPGAQPGSFPKRVNARGNFWGPDADRDPAAGTLGKIRDGRKFGPVKYDGSGDAEFSIDVVDFSEEATSPVKDAGPRSGRGPQRDDSSEDGASKGPAGGEDPR